MWETYSEKTGLYSPHVNYCSGSEEFIAIAGGNLGYCIDKSQSAAAQWEDARDLCATNGKRQALKPHLLWAFVIDLIPDFSMPETNRRLNVLDRRTRWRLLTS